MQRLLLQQLVLWREAATRKPILLDGARQVGKTHLVETLFGKPYFTRTHKLDFLSDPSLALLFEDSLEPEAILGNIEIRFNISIDLKTDLIFFDEVGECQAALNSLKYFAEKLPHAFICASGSNIGLLESFPVGKVQALELFPLVFEEFLMAADNPALLVAFQNKSRSKSVHDLLWKLLLDYYFTGGMPEAVEAWFQPDSGVHERSQRIKQIHKDLVTGYQRDFGKYSGKTNAQHIDAVFLTVPRQLASNMDESVKRFLFKDVIEKKQRYAELRGPIDWLERTKLVSKCYPITSRPISPLPALIRENVFKLFLFDVGVLGYLLEMTYEEQLAQKTFYKGFIAENFVQNELRARVGYPTYSWEEARGEIEFLHKCKNGEVIPVEVKSGSRTRARSLRSFIARYSPTRSIKLIGSAGGSSEDGMMVWPLYYAQFLREL